MIAAGLCGQQHMIDNFLISDRRRQLAAPRPILVPDSEVFQFQQYLAVRFRHFQWF